MPNYVTPAKYPQDKLTAVTDAVRRIVERWVITRTDLIADAFEGDGSIQVKSTRRFNIGEQFLIQNDVEDIENQLYVIGVPDRNTIILGNADGTPKTLKWSWPLSAGASIVKTQNDQLVKAVFFGDPDIIEDLPAISVSMQNRNSDFFTLRATKERYNLEIAVYVSGTTQEEGDRFLSSMVSIIQWGLKQNFYPLLNDYATTTVLADIVAQDRYIKVPDSSFFVGGTNQIIVEDEYNIEVHCVVAICDATTIQIALPLQNDYSKDDVIIIKPNRLPFNSWPTDVTFGKIKKGTLLKAGIVTYFVEEMEDHEDGGFGDTQIR